MSTDRFWTVAGRVCTESEKELLILRADGLGWRKMAEELHRRHGHEPALTTVRDRWANARRKVLNAMSEEA